MIEIRDDENWPGTGVSDAIAISSRYAEYRVGHD
jgi:hypothetical protein